MLVARQYGQAGVQVVLDSRIEGGPDPDLPERQTVGVSNARDLLHLRASEFGKQPARLVGAARHKGRGRLHANPNRRAGTPPEEPPDGIPPVMTRRRTAEATCSLDRLAKLRYERRRGQIQVSDALAHGPSYRVRPQGPPCLGHAPAQCQEPLVRALELVENRLKLRVHSVEPVVESAEPGCRLVDDASQLRRQRIEHVTAGQKPGRRTRFAPVDRTRRRTSSFARLRRRVEFLCMSAFLRRSYAPPRRCGCQFG